MQISLYCVDPFESKLDFNKVTRLLNSCPGVQIKNQGSIGGELPDGELDYSYFDRCLAKSGDEFAIFVTSRPLAQNWYVLRNHLNMKDCSFINRDKKWIAVTVDFLEDLAQLKDLDLNRLCAFNIYKAIITSELLYSGLTYIGDIYLSVTSIEDSSFIFCRNKLDFVTAYKLGKLGSRLESTLTRNNFTKERIENYRKGLSGLQENSFQNFLRIRNKREYSHNIIISVLFGTLASLIASFLYTSYMSSNEAALSDKKSEPEIEVSKMSSQK